MKNTTTSKDVQPEPLSPELALVDPEAARRAREEMSAGDEHLLLDGAADADGAASPARGLDGGAPPAEASATKEPSIRDRLAAAGMDRGALYAAVADRTGPEVEAVSADDERDDEEPRRRSRLRPVFATLAGLVCVAGIAVGGAFLIDRAADRTRAEADAAPSAGGEIQPQPHGPAAGGTTSAGRPAAPPPPEPPTPQPANGGRGAARPPTRTFVWPQVRAATAYRVEFFRRGHKIFEASPVKPRLELPRRWTYNGRRYRLTAGTYHWRVRPAFGHPPARLGTPITRSTWTVR